MCLSVSIKTVVQQPRRSLLLKSQIRVKEREHVHALGLTAVRDIGTVKQLRILEWFI